MPTGYAAPVESGEITELREYAWQCARAFGALVTMRDSSMGAKVPTELKPEAYHLDEMRKAEARLRALEVATDDNLAAEHRRQRAEVAEAIERGRREMRAELARYEAMAEKVRAWVAPTPDHEPLREFMLSQIKESSRHHVDHFGDEPPEQTVAELRANQTADAKHDRDYHAAEWKKEQERTAKRNQWLKALRDSVGDPP